MNGIALGADARFLQRFTMAQPRSPMQIKIFRGDLAPLGRHHGPSDPVDESSEPWIFVMREHFKEVGRQQFQIFFSFAKRRHGQWQHIKPVQQVFTEQISHDENNRAGTVKSDASPNVTLSNILNGMCSSFLLFP